MGATMVILLPSPQPIIVRHRAVWTTAAAIVDQTGYAAAVL
jgi:hypothetical protein